jgi:tetratricopeptide (TPR) repeat protein
MMDRVIGLMLLSRILAAVALTFSLAHASPASAQDNAASLASTEVQTLFNEGIASYRLGQFDKALESFEAALKLDHRPPIILNIAQCHRQLGQAEKAIFSYRLYRTEWRRRFPNGESPFEEEVAAHIVSLEKQLAEEQAARRRAAVQKEGAGVPPAALPRPAPAKEAPTPLYKRWWFWSVIGAAVVGGTVAAIAATTGGDDRMPIGQDGTFAPGSF